QAAAPAVEGEGGGAVGPAGQIHGGVALSVPVGRDLDVVNLAAGGHQVALAAHLERAHVAPVWRAAAGDGLRGAGQIDLAEVDAPGLDRIAPHEHVGAPVGVEVAGEDGAVGAPVAVPHLAIEAAAVREVDVPLLEAVAPHHDVGAQVAVEVAGDR